MKTNNHSSSFRFLKFLYPITLCVVFTVAVIGFLKLADLNETAVSAQESDQPVKSSLTPLETNASALNQTIDSAVRVCKIAGSGIAENDPNTATFAFTVTGTILTETTPTTFETVTRRVSVVAGAAAQGGNCELVRVSSTDNTPQRFVIGTPVTVTEIGLRTINGAAIRTSRIRSSTGEFTDMRSPNPDIEPTTERISTATITARGEVTEFEFTNFLFRPALLKICKIAGSQALVGQTFVFDVTLISPTGLGGNLFPAATTSVTVTAGLNNAQGGICEIVDGTNFLGGQLNAGSTVTIVERSTGISRVSAIASSTALTGGLIANLPTRTATLTGTGGLRSTSAVIINVVTFINVSTVIIEPGPLPFDFDGDGKADLSTFTASNGAWRILGSSAGLSSVQFGASSDKLAPADFDGDGKTDVAVYRPATGQWFIQRSTDGFYAIQFGEAGDIAQPGDYDGDGKADIALFRPSNGIWYILGTSRGFYGMQFGSGEDRPVVADYDGDGRADVAVYRPSNGTWYLNRTTTGFTGIQFGGNSSDKAVPNDYDVDGKTDIAIYRNGTWYLNRTTGGFASVQFGSSADFPVAADYNGDRRVDFAVYRDGLWHILDSGAGGQIRGIQFGTSMDIPVPGAYIQ